MCDKKNMKVFIFVVDGKVLTEVYTSKRAGCRENDINVCSVNAGKVKFRSGGKKIEVIKAEVVRIKGRKGNVKPS